ncbi:hypothetical protein N7478_000602 [Penicillium angulare]|uniref:uncharacterized protein n=1 Tax=Penicillium angulare TaxID=116970 RepID=UPI002542658E|nr:uncharacterized protein N7478_000602 [Penicillium angulare]KAJ5291351.1 hypothetical protein N7478_000602 [Penicillium angulare]
MFHLAQILLLTTNPLQDTNSLLAFRTIETQLIYHARQICGIAQSRPDGSCRVNSVQPLYYAGCCFNRDDERKATVKLLEDIENELGWASIYRARDLEAIWS